MKILFSPSEAKHSTPSDINFSLSSLLFSDLNKREFVVKKYQDFIASKSIEEVSDFFGLKDIDEVKRYKELKVLNSSALMAIQRYDGVAYDYLNFNTLEKASKDFVLTNTIIFSNLFGAIRASN